MKKNLKKIVLSALIFSMFFAFSPRPARADIWGESIIGAMTYKEVLEEMYQKMQDTVLATFKMNAIRTAQSRLNSIIGSGTGGQPQIVTNWDDAIYGTANKQATQAAKDYFSQTKSAAGGTGGQKIVSEGEKMYNTNALTMQPTIDKYIQGGQINKIFDKNSTPNSNQALNDLTKIQNNPAFYAMNAQGLYAANYGVKAGSETAKNIAYGGVKATEKTNGATGATTVTMPGSVKRDVFSEITNMPTKMITLAKSVPEVAAALVTQMLTQTINQGFSMMNQQIDRGVNTLRSQTGASIPQAQSLIQKGVR